MEARNRIQELRSQQRLSQQGLAVRAGTSPAIVTMVEKYGHLPGADLRQRIAEALQVTEGEVWPELTGTNDKEGNRGDRRETDAHRERGGDRDQRVFRKSSERLARETPGENAHG